MKSNHDHQQDTPLFSPPLEHHFREYLIAMLTLLIMWRFLYSDPVNTRNFESIKAGMNARQIELILGQADEHVGTLEGRRIIGGHWGVYFDDKETVVGAAKLYAVDVGCEESLREVIHRWFAAH